MFCSMFETGLHRSANPGGHDYWSELEAVHAQHRHHVRNLLGIGAALAALAVVVHPVMLGFVAALAPLLLLELWMGRRSRPTSKIPDFRPSERLEVELDDA